MEITVENFKQLYTANLSTFNLNALEHYLAMGEKLLCNLVELDPIVVEVVSKLGEELRNRG